MESDTHTFQAADYIVFGLMLSLSALIGIYYRFVGGKQRTAKEYLLADKSMGIIPVAFSLMASFMSAVTLLGLSAENYMRGTQFVVINVAYVIGTPIAAYVFLPVFFRARSASAFEYLEHRFNKTTRLFASFVFMVQMVLYMSVVLYAPALALSAVTGLAKWPSVVSIGVVCTFYSTIGGIKAVLWTDVFQSILMYTAVFTVIIKGTMDVGSLSEVWRIAQEGGRIEFLNYDPDPTVRHSIWTLAIGGIFTYVAVYGVNQAQIQRLLTIGSLKNSQMALWVSWPILTLLSLSTSLAGIVVYANFYNCDPMLRSSTTKVYSSDQVLPYFVMQSLGSMPGIPGLFVAGIFSGALSTMSSAINSLAAVTYEDFIHPFLAVKKSSFQSVTVIKCIALIYGAACIALTYLVDQVGGVLQASLSILNLTGGPLLGIFSLGMLFRFTKTKASLLSFVIALCLSFWIAIGAYMHKLKPENLPLSVSGCLNNFTDSATTKSFTVVTELPGGNNGNTTVNPGSAEYVLPLYKLSYMWYAFFGWLVTVILGVVGSLIPGDEKKVSPLLFSPVIHSAPLEEQKDEEQWIPMNSTHL